MKSFRFIAWLPLIVFAMYSCSSGWDNSQDLPDNTEPPIVSEVEQDAESEDAEEIETGYESGTETESEPAPETGTESEPETGTAPEPETETEADGGDGLKVKPEVEDETKLEAEPEVEGGIKPDKDSDENTPGEDEHATDKNDRMPALVFNELRTEYSTNPSLRVEFVEFLALRPGNIGALRLFIASNSLSIPVYEFPQAEVKVGERIVLHLRSVEEGLVDETGEDLGLSGGTDAQSDARDFWIPGSKKLLRRTDAIWIMDQDDQIIDAVLLSETGGSQWNNAKIAEAAEFLAKKKAWLPNSGAAGEKWIPSPADAVLTARTTVTRTICRDEEIPPGPHASNWYLTDTGCATPGNPNNPKRFVH